MDNLTASNPAQLDLFGAVLASYMDGQPRTNESLYRDLSDSGLLSASELESKVPVGRAGVGFNLAKRRVRWYQQTLKERGVLERVPGERGTWRIAERDKNELPPPIRRLEAVSRRLSRFGQFLAAIQCAQGPAQHDACCS